LYPGVVFYGLICVRLPFNAGAITCMNIVVILVPNFIPGT